jgi:hypothetical protein
MLTPTYAVCGRIRDIARVYVLALGLKYCLHRKDMGDDKYSQGVARNIFYYFLP